jgi:hypothetical protein
MWRGMYCSFVKFFASKLDLGRLMDRGHCSCSACMHMAFFHQSRRDQDPRRLLLTLYSIPSRSSIEQHLLASHLLARGQPIPNFPCVSPQCLPGSVPVFAWLSSPQFFFYHWARRLEKAWSCIFGSHLSIGVAVRSRCRIHDWWLNLPESKSW